MGWWASPGPCRWGSPAAFAFLVACQTRWLCVYFHSLLPKPWAMAYVSMLFAPGLCKLNFSPTSQKDWGSFPAWLMKPRSWWTNLKCWRELCVWVYLFFFCTKHLFLQIFMVCLPGQCDSGGREFPGAGEWRDEERAGSRGPTRWNALHGIPSTRLKRTWYEFWLKLYKLSKV